MMLGRVYGQELIGENPLGWLGQLAFTLDNYIFGWMRYPYLLPVWQSLGPPGHCPSTTCPQFHLSSWSYNFIFQGKLFLHDSLFFQRILIQKMAVGICHTKGMSVKVNVIVNLSLGWNKAWEFLSLHDHSLQVILLFQYFSPTMIQNAKNKIK